MKKIIFGSLIALSLFISCNIINVNRNESASLTIKVIENRSDETSRTVTADFTTQADAYEIRIANRASYETKSQTLSGTASYTFDSLEVGIWDIEVIARKGGIQIALGTVSGQELSAGQTALVHVILSPTFLEGTGGFVFKAQFPSDLGIDSVSGVFDGESVIPAYSDVAGKRIAVFSKNGVSNGIHKLFLTFRRGETLAGVYVETVNVWSGIISDKWIAGDGSLTASRAFTASDFFDNNANLADLVLTPGLAGFSSTVGTYDAGVVHDTQVTFRPTESVAGQHIEYNMDGGAWATVRTGEDTLVTLANAGAVLTIRVTAPDGVSQKTYGISYLLQVEDPVVSVSGGTYATDKSVSITTSTSGAVVRYTLDGVDPGEASDIASGSITVDRPLTLKAISYKDGWNPSGMVTMDYGFKVATPVFEPQAGGGWIITCATPGATIRYGSGPADIDGTSPEYVPDTLVTTTGEAIKARAFRDLWSDSELGATSAAPTAAFTTNIANPYVGGTIRFDASATTDDDTLPAELVFRWTFGDGTVTTAWSTANSIDFAYAGAGTFNAMLEAKDKHGVIGSMTKIMTVVIPTVPRNGLVAEYLFNGDASDTSGNRNTGMVEGAILTTDRFGRSSSAFSFDGSNDYIEVTDSPSLRLSSAYSVSAWIKANSFNFLAGIIGKNQSMGSYDWGGIRLSPSTPYNTIDSFGGANNKVIISDKWYHIVGVMDNGNRWTNYVDGEIIFDGTYPTEIVSNNDPVVIGADWLFGGGRFFNGVIDDARIYNRALGAEEINDLYIEGGYNPPIVPEVISGGESVQVFNGHRYQIITNNLSWGDAKAFAEQYGGTLAIIETQTEYDFLLSILNNRTVWLGATDEATEGVWLWVDGKNLAEGFVNWYPGEPNDAGNQDYMDFYSFGGYNDSFNDSNKPFIIEWETLE